MKTKNAIPLSLLLTITIFSSCSDRIYLPALLRNDISYLPRPMATDTTKTVQYLAGAVTFDNGAAGANDNVTIAQLNYSRAHTFDFINVAYGGYGFGGSYVNNTYTANDSYYFSHKSFFGLGGRASANFFIPTGRADIRLLGVEMSYSKEFGDYLAYRRLVRDQPGFTIDDRSALFTGGLTTEVIWHGAKNRSTQFGFRLFVGENFGRPQSQQQTGYGYDYQADYYKFSTLSYFLKIKRYYIVLEGSSGIQFKLAYQL